MVYTIQGLFDFLAEGVSPFHAAAAAVRRLEAAGFARLDEARPWALTPGGRYYLVRGGSAVVALRLPQGKAAGWRIAASHGDSPTFRVKSTQVAGPGGTTKLETETYGGLIHASWLDRPLTVAGRLMVRTAEGVRPRLVYLDRDLCCIPSLAIHLDRACNQGKKLDPQKDLQPLLGRARGRTLDSLLAGEGGVCPAADILAMDLTLTPRQKPVRLGPEGEFFMSPRIDDLECAYTTLCGFLDAEPPADQALVWAMLDNEEVGSGSPQGALGDLLPRTLGRVADALGMDAQQQAMALAGSFALSCDNAHAIHPNAPEAADPEHAPMLNGGVVLKWNASQKYATNALSGAVFGELCARAGVPVQHYANRAGQPGGSTLGNLQSRTVSVPMADVGLAQLAMHACVETAGTEDAAYMARALQAFYSAALRPQPDGGWALG